MNKKIKTAKTTKIAIHNGIIETPIPYSAIEMKVFLAIAHKLQSKKYQVYRYEDVDFTESITFKAKEIAEIIGITKNSYKNFSVILDSLLKTIIVLPNPNNPNGCIKVHFLRAVNYDDGFISIIPEKMMIPFYIKLVDNFTSLELNVLKRFKSSHTIKIYSLIKQYRNLSKERKFLINDLKYKLGIENKYSSIKDFRINVLDMVKKELNSVLEGINFDYEFIRSGREYNEIILRYNFFGVKNSEVNSIDLADSTVTSILQRECLKCVLEKKNNNKICDTELSEVDEDNTQCIYCLENNLRGKFFEFGNKTDTK